MLAPNPAPFDQTKTQKTKLNTISIFQEFDSSEVVETRSFLIPRATLNPTRDIEIKLTATITGTSNDATRDAVFFRRVRKQCFSAIQMVLQQMVNRKLSVDSLVPELCDDVEFAIEQLSNSVTAQRFEGNALELLRLIRDSLKNTGWTQYKKPNVPRKLRAAIEECAFGDSVEPADIEKMRYTFRELGLTPSFVLDLLKSQFASH